MCSKNSTISSSKNNCGICYREEITQFSSNSPFDDYFHCVSTIPVEVDQFWIQCDMCEVWFHGKCVSVEEYESAIIDFYHCPSCCKFHGPSILKSIHNDHRYAYDDVTQFDLPIQIGTKCFIDQFKLDQEKFIIKISDQHFGHFSTGYEFMTQFSMRKIWSKLYLIDDPRGLNLRLPNSNFTVDECVKLMGKNLAVDTIDVYKQHTYHMTLGRFLQFWKEKERSRLYNILSLEFSQSNLHHDHNCAHLSHAPLALHCRMADLVRLPSFVSILSWVSRLWPESTVADGVNLDALKPRVSMFCLIGMKDSYTDFHIDFGGSSVWYHVFRGKKVFYLIEPTGVHLRQFAEYQKSLKRSETFFGDLLPRGSLMKLEVNQGQTLAIPGGWIHAVWTPKDSLVFGGNFIHSLDIAIQLRVYEMEQDCRTDERFMFPSFELTNWYAAKNCLELLKDANEDRLVVDSYLINGAKAMLPSLRRWKKQDRGVKKSTIVKTTLLFGDIIQKLQREVNLQSKLRKQKTTTVRSSLTAKKPPKDGAKTLSSLRLKFRLDDCHELSDKPEQKPELVESLQVPIEVDDERDIPARSKEESTVTRIKIRIGQKKREDLERELKLDDESLEDDQDISVDDRHSVTTMFGVSSHGRVQRPTAWVELTKDRFRSASCADCLSNSDNRSYSPPNNNGTVSQSEPPPPPCVDVSDQDRHLSAAVRKREATVPTTSVSTAKKIPPHARHLSLTDVAVQPAGSSKGRKSGRKGSSTAKQRLASKLKML